MVTISEFAFAKLQWGKQDLENVKAILICQFLNGGTFEYTQLKQENKSECTTKKHNLLEWRNVNSLNIV